ncbi:MAG: competence/damage-inducible protein A [Syntrophales bacterium]|nr:competence/damage-inducible protein A [Syntrophales bacterium]
MNVGILTIGNELTTGRIVDHNAAMIAREVHQKGWRTVAIESVGDNFTDIEYGLRFLLERADVIVITGGLGPTQDDITTEAIARFFNLPLYTEENVLAHIKNLFASRNLPWTENNAKQARFPIGAEIIPNTTGTAPGFALYREQKLIAVIPGVPSEAAQMFSSGVLPLMKRFFPESTGFTFSRTYKTFGLTESRIDEILKDVKDDDGIEIGFYPIFPENHVVITVKDSSETIAFQKFQRVCSEVENRLSSYIFATDEETLEQVVASKMIKKGLTLSVAESCTGGLIADHLTDVPGSSAFFERGLIAYSNTAKVEILGVPETTIERYGAVSEETARLMAEGIKKISRTDLGLSTTGIAGPTGGTDVKPVGTVYIALADDKDTFVRHYTFRWNRRRNKIIMAHSALMLLNNYLKGKLK